MVHNFTTQPELTNAQMQFYYFLSPHRQITESFDCRVSKVTDGDTIQVEWSERDFPTTIRLAKINAPELKTQGGKESKSWLEGQLNNQDIRILIDQENRTGKFGRIIGEVIKGGININDESLRQGFSKEFR